MINGDNLKKRSLTKLWIKFNDGNTRPFYSAEDNKYIQKQDPLPGVIKLKKLLDVKYEGKWAVAVLYGNNYRPGDLEIKVSPGETNNLLNIA